MEDKAWNLALTAVYATRAYQDGLQGARALIDFTEKFEQEGRFPARSPAGGMNRPYERNLIRIALLELTCLDRLDRLGEYLEAWNGWRSRPLALFYELAKRSKPRLQPFIIEETGDHLIVHFLYLTRARKELIEKKLGRNFRRHAQQEDLTEGEIRDRLSRAAIVQSAD